MVLGPCGSLLHGRRPAEDPGRRLSATEDSDLRLWPAHIGSAGCAELDPADVVDRDEPRAADRSTRAAHHDPVRPRLEPTWPGAEPDVVDPSVAPHPEAPDAAAIGRQLEQVELDRP